MISFMNTSWLSEETNSLLASLTSSLPSTSKSSLKSSLTSSSTSLLTSSSTSSLTSSKTSSLTSSITPSSSLISLASVLSLSLSCFLLLFQLYESHTRKVYFRFGGNCCCWICHLSVWLRLPTNRMRKATVKKVAPGSSATARRRRGWRSPAQWWFVKAGNLLGRFYCLQLANRHSTANLPINH